MALSDARLILLQAAIALSAASVAPAQEGDGSIFDFGKPGRDEPKEAQPKPGEPKRAEPAPAPTPPAKPATPKPPAAEEKTDPAVAFKELFGTDVDAAAKTPSPKDDAALAAKVLGISREADDAPRFRRYAYERAYELGTKDPAGYDSAIEAATSLASSDPERRAQWRKKRLDVYQLAFQRSTGADRGAAQEMWAAQLVRAGDEHCREQNAAEAAELYRTALSVTAAEGRPSVQARLKYAQDQVALRKRVAALEASWKNPDTAGESAKALARVWIVESGDYAQAKILAKYDSELLSKIALAERSPAELDEAQLAEMATWYERMAEGATAAGQYRMLTRAKQYNDLFLSRHTLKDVKALAAKSAAARIAESIAPLAAVCEALSPDAPPPAVASGATNATATAKAPTPDAAPAPAPAPVRVPTTPMPSTGATTVAKLLQGKRKATDPAAGAVVFEAPAGDGRRGANGVLVTAAGPWTKTGTEWRYRYVRAEDKQGVQLVHPLGDGHVVVAVKNDSVAVFDGGAWERFGYTSGGGLKVERGPGFEQVFPIEEGKEYDVVSRVDPDGRCVVTINGKPVAGVRLAAPPALSLGLTPGKRPPGTSSWGELAFKGEGLPARLSKGQAMILVEPMDGGPNSVKEPEFRPGWAAVKAQ